MACTMAASPVLAAYSRGHARSHSSGDAVVVSSTRTPPKQLADEMIFEQKPSPASHQRRPSAPPAYGVRDSLDDDRQAAPTGAAPDALIMPSMTGLRGYAMNLFCKREQQKPLKARVDYPTFMADNTYEVK